MTDAFKDPAVLNDDAWVRVSADIDLELRFAAFSVGYEAALTALITRYHEPLVRWRACRSASGW